MRKNGILLLLMILLAFSCQKKQYASFQMTNSESYSVAVSKAPPPAKSIEYLKPTSLIVNNTRSSNLTLPNIINSTEQVKAKTNNIRQYRRTAFVNKIIARKLNDRKPEKLKTEDKYKSLGIASMLLGIITSFLVFLSLASFLSPTGLLLAGLTGLFALIFGIKAIGKLKGEYKIPSLIGIIFGSVGFAMGLYILIFIIAYLTA